MLDALTTDKGAPVLSPLQTSSLFLKRRGSVATVYNRRCSLINSKVVGSGLETMDTGSIREDPSEWDTKENSSKKNKFA